jgi:glutaredoxin 3
VTCACTVVTGSVARTHTRWYERSHISPFWSNLAPRSKLDMLAARLLLLASGTTALRLGMPLTPRRHICHIAPLALATLAPLRVDARTITSSAAGGDLVSQIKATTAENKVVIYSKSYCPFCAKTKDLFTSMGVDYTAIELDQMDQGADLQDALLGLTKQRTVPNVFVAGTHVGGNDDTQTAARSGKLKELLDK